MNSPPPGDRHLTRDGLEHYIAAGAPAIIKIEGEPVAYLVVEPPNRLALRAPRGRNSIPNLSAYKHFSASTIHWNDAQWCELTVEGPIARDAYPVICSIADALQLDGADFASAVTCAFAKFKELLETRRRLSFQQQVGLFGELLLLRHLLTCFEPKSALSFWHGPDGEEHDFDVEGHDLEVKSTVAESRSHWIASLHQLEPSLGRSLWLISIQLTAASTGGLRLGELILDIKTTLRSDTALELFDRKLQDAGWRDEDMPDYTSSWRLRSEPAAFAVDRDFPTLTSRLLADAGADLARFVAVTYVIDLTGLAPASSPPHFLLDFDS